MKLTVRIHDTFDRWHETFMLFKTRHARKPKIRKRENIPSIEEPWYSGDAYTCIYCDWVLMRWNKEHLLGWQCHDCGQKFHPRLATTEKRPAVHLSTPIPQSGKMPVSWKPTFRTGQLSFLHSRHVITNSTERLPNGLPRLEWRNGARIDTDELPHITPPYNRRTG